MAKPNVKDALAQLHGCHTVHIVKRQPGVWRYEANSGKWADYRLASEDEVKAECGAWVQGAMGNPDFVRVHVERDVYTSEDGFQTVAYPFDFIRLAQYTPGHGYPCVESYGIMCNLLALLEADGVTYESMVAARELIARVEG